MYYLYTRLALGSRSSPKIFNNLSIAMCWILHNNYGINTVLHLLDDFLTIDRPLANADATMKILVSVFSSLEIPIATHKTLGPVTCIEYLGIILETIRMEARLPADKLCRIKEYLLLFLNRKTCTKHGPFSSTVSDSISGTLSLPTPLRNSVELSCVINNLWSKKYNSATRDAYTSGYWCFLKFRTSQFEGEEIIGNVMSNISEDILICLVSYCQSVLDLKYSTIKLYLAGIRHFSIASYSVNPLFDNVGKPLLRLQNILNGIKKTENKSIRQKLPITYSVLHQIYQHLQKGESHLGLNADKYSGHSFRIGAATTCSSNGIQDHMIQSLGRWKSDCYSRYIRTFEVDILYFIEEPEGKITLYEGESFELTYETSRIELDVVIYKNDIFVDEHILFISHVHIKDEGLYYAECYGLRSKYTKLTVLRKFLKKYKVQIFQV
ncbi:unnamed protein product [Mytilus coruscus]|uniref:Reverse transcriptase domain-containing protein n=1 Tax=Mytilus coruscus TaxID=42192 RepID=A0A6J8ERH4_MYTCO|nr:unnamed protein product [Mytilus coruscus]